MAGTFTATGLTSDGLSVTITGQIGGGALPPSPGINVKEHGALGDGLADDRPAIQAVMDGANAGQTVYLPTGAYRLGGALLLRHSGVTLAGDGDASRLLIGSSRGLWVGGGGPPVDAAAIKKLALVGQPGKYGADGNTAHAVLCDGATQTVIEDVLLSGVGQGVYSVNGAVGTTHRRVRVQGWGGTALGLNTGSKVEDCRLTQDDPNLTGQRSGHGIYCHNGAANVSVKNTIVTGARMFGAHLYGEQVGLATGPILFSNCLFRDCYGSFICANYPAEAARVQGLTVTDCQFLGGYGGISVTIRQGDGIVFQRNTIKNAVQGFQALAIGQWGPNDLNGLITNANFSGNTIDGFQYGLYLLASNGGRFVNTVVGPNTITNCGRPLIVDAAGVTLLP